MLGDALADQLLDGLDGLLVRRRHQRDRGAGASGAAGAADAVDVVVGVMGNVEIEDVAHRGNIEAAGGDVGGDEQRQLALAELVQRGEAGGLFHVAVQGADGEAVLLQGFGELRDFALAVAEDDRVLEVFGLAQQGAEHFALLPVVAGDGDLRLGDGGCGGGRLGDLDLHRIMQEGLGDAADFRRHGRREEERLAGERHQLADAFDVGDEAHVQHAVGFVDHQQFDAGEEEAAALGVVEQAARGGDEDVDAAGQLHVLVAERDAADQQRHIELLAGAVFVELFLHLRREFAGRLEDQRARHAGAGAAFFEKGEHRQHEGCGLAGTGLGDAEHVLACQNVGNRLFLNGGGGGVASGRDGGENLVGQAEIGKGH